MSGAVVPHTLREHQSALGRHTVHTDLALERAAQRRRGRGAAIRCDCIQRPCLDVEVRDEMPVESPVPQIIPPARMLKLKYPLTGCPRLEQTNVNRSPGLSGINQTEGVPTDFLRLECGE